MAVFPTNAVLIFQLPTGTESIGYVGNPESASTVLTVEASFSINSKRQDDVAGQYANRIDVMALKGRCNRVYTDSVEYTPPRIPPEIRPGVRVPCTLTNRDTQETLVGEFQLDVSLPSKWGVDKVLGGQINGNFYITSTAGDLV